MVARIVILPELSMFIRRSGYLVTYAFASNSLLMNKRSWKRGGSPKSVSCVLQVVDRATKNHRDIVHGSCAIQLQHLGVFFFKGSPDDKVLIDQINYEIYESFSTVIPR
jgi:hypothetical protein